MQPLAKFKKNRYQGFRATSMFFLNYLKTAYSLIKCYNIIIKVAYSNTQSELLPLA